eukprot:maker-scaffold_91-snap-gene-0.39-mRNA-1 protein AED:0.12 eAED:0.12 QI:205/1/1/1/0.66/0.5/4/144/443
MVSVSEAKKKCPSLIVVDGSDLTPFREASEKINNFWFEKVQSYKGGMVEKKGFDEVFIDVTGMVESRIQSFHFLVDDEKRAKLLGGTVIESADVQEEEYKKLAVASQIAQEWRSEVFEKLGYTCCAGISSGKVGAKFAVNHNKPNGQAVLFSSTLKQFLMEKPVRSIQGVGSALNRDLYSAVKQYHFEGGKMFDIDYHQLTCKMIAEIGKSYLMKNVKPVDSAQFVWNVINGEDISALTPSSPFQKNISVETTDLPHPTDLKTVLNRLPQIFKTLVDLIFQRMRKTQELPEKLKLTLCHKPKGAKGWGDWIVKTKSRNIMYSEDRYFSIVGFGATAFLKSTEILAKSLFDLYFTEMERKEELNFVRINISVFNFKDAKQVARNLASKPISAYFSKSPIPKKRMKGMHTSKKPQKKTVDQDKEIEFIEILEPKQKEEIIDLSVD